MPSNGSPARRGIAINAGKHKALVVPDEFTGRDIKDFRVEFGFAPRKALANPQEVDLDVVAGLLWLALRRRNPRITIDEVLDDLTYENIDVQWGVTDVDAEEGDLADDPEG